MTADGTATRVRLDKWLWAARFYKTRSLATQAVDGGKVKLNGERIKPAHGVRVGDRVDVQIGSLSWDLEVVALSDRRGPAPVAALLYRETDESRARRATAIEKKKVWAEPAEQLKGRPTKRDRRDLDRVHGKP